MSQAEELLNSLSVDTVSSQTETEPHIIINRDRSVVVPEELKRLAVQYDHNIETVTFDCPRYWDEHDLMSLILYINYVRGDGKQGRYKAKNVRVDTRDNTIIHFEWTISRKISAVPGMIKFLACAKTLEANGTERLHWNSDVNLDTYVSEGLETDEPEVEVDVDELSNLLLRIDELDDSIEALDPIFAVETYNEAVSRTQGMIEEAKTEVEETVASVNSRLDQFLDIKSEARESVVVNIEKHSEDNAIEGYIIANGDTATIVVNSIRFYNTELDANTYETNVLLGMAKSPIIEPVTDMHYRLTNRMFIIDEITTCELDLHTEWDASEDALIFYINSFPRAVLGNVTLTYSLAHPTINDPLVTNIDDLKVGFDGTIYDSPGTAVREQYKKLSDDISELERTIEEIEEDDVDTSIIVQEMGYDENKVMSQKAVTEVYSSILSEISDKNDNTVQLHKELYRLPRTGIIPLYMYGINDSGNSYETDKSCYGTDYMLCPKYLLFDFNDEQARLVVYFYDFIDGVYVPRWDIIKHKTTDNVYNYLARSTSYNSVIEIPDGVYMRIATVIDGDVNVYGWSGVHIGNEMAGTYYVPTENSNGEYTEEIMGTKRTGITIPGDATLFWVKDFVIRDLWGIDFEEKEISLEKNKYVQLVRLPKGYKCFRLNLAKRDSIRDFTLFSNVKDATYSNNWNDKASCLCDFTVSRSYGNGRRMLDNAKYISDIEWVCKKDTMISDAPTSAIERKFHSGTLYTGIPYSSQWIKANYFGWHITKHTFLNAANDENSVFYTESGKRGGPGYGTVCSAFATLCAGFPNPVVTSGLLKDPNISHVMTRSPQVGSIVYNNDGHCMMVDTVGDGTNFSQYTLYEGASPTTLRRSNFDFYKRRDGASHYDYINDFIYSVYHKDETGSPRGYNITNGTVTNGSARPNRGDRSVYTSDDEVLINIKNSSATKCYVQRCIYDINNDSFITTVDSPMEYDIPEGITQILIDNSTLASYCYYGVYTDVDSVMEYFEYHVVTGATYSVSTNNLTFDIPQVDQHNILSDYTVNDTISNSVKYEWNGSTSCHIFGTPIAGSLCRIFSDPEALPAGLTPGRKYIVKLSKSNNNVDMVYIRLYYRDKNNPDELIQFVSTKTSAEFTIPETAQGMQIRIATPENATGKYIDETVGITISNVEEPWYSCVHDNEVENGDIVIIPYKKNGDYSDYRKTYNTTGADGVMFYKGTLGAYTSKLSYYKK